MKTLKIITILLLTIITYSCSSNSVEDEQEENYFIKAKIDGVNFFSDFPITQASLIEPDFLAIGGQNEDNTIMVQIGIKNYIGSGTYTFGSDTDNDNVCQILKNGIWITSKHLGSGTVILTQNGKLLTGTFSFIAIKDGESMNITEGTFRTIKPI